MFRPVVEPDMRV